MTQANPAGAQTATNDHALLDTRSAEKYINPARMQSVLRIFDGAAILLTLTYLFYIALLFLGPEAAIIAALFLATEVTYFCMIGLRWIRIYDIDFLTNPIRGLIAACGVTCFVGGASLLITNSFLFPLIPGTPLAWLGTIAAYFGMTRIVAGLWAKPLADAGAFRQRIAIVGGDENAGKLIDALETSDDIDVEILGMFDNRDDDRSPPVVRGYRKLGRISALREYCENNRVDLVILAIPMTAHARLMQLLPQLWKLPVDVRISGQAIDMKLSPRAYTFLGKLPLLTVFSRALDERSLRVKDIADKAIAALLITMISPVMLLTGLAVFITNGGRLFDHQAFTGFDGKPINLLRFRTRKGEAGGGGDRPYTLIGRWIENATLHEMPELFNVIKGDIAIVGPAIHTNSDRDDIGLYEKVCDSYCVRHGIRPGLVGWAQIHGFGGELDNDEKIENRVKYDLEYVDRFNWIFDLRILAQTPFAWLRSRSPQYVV